MLSACAAAFLLSAVVHGSTVLHVVETEQVSLSEAGRAAEVVATALGNHGLGPVSVIGLDGCDPALDHCASPERIPDDAVEVVTLRVVGGPRRVMVLAARDVEGERFKSSTIFGADEESWAASARQLVQVLFPVNPEATEGGARNAGIVPWVLVGAGIAAIVGSVVFELQRRDVQAEMDDAILAGPSYSDLRQTRDFNLTARNLSLSAGGAAVLSGVLLGF